MAFDFCDSMIHDYRTTGYVIFRQIVPPALLTDLRRAAARAAELARGRYGPQAQRIQPVTQHFDESELKIFHDFLNHAPLVDAIHRVLTPRHELGGAGSGIERLGILVEPAQHPSCTAWHRDIRETSGVPDVEEFRRINHDPLWFNQFNCPIYEDHCTWYVPGSYLRSFDLPGEASVGAPPELGDSATDEQREQAFLAYCRKMPGAIRASMDAGDFMLYHPNAWHLGNYLPYRKRVTFHGYAPSPELLDWYARWRDKAAKATKAA